MPFLKAARVGGPVAKLVLVDDADVVARASALACEHLRDAVQARGYARLGISGGSAMAPVKTIRALMGEVWKQVRLTWVDERCVDTDDEDSNRGTAYRQGGLSNDDVPGVELALWKDGEGSAQALARVERGLLAEFDGALDLALLGMGPDGHIASLFPGHPQMQPSTDASVQYIEDSPKPPPSRMTLSLSFLKNSSQNILVATGEAKREAILRVLAGDPALPASALSNLTILTNINISEDKATQ